MVAVQKAISISYSERVFVPLIIQQAMHMYRIIVSSVAQPALQNFSILSRKRHDFRGKNLSNTKCVFFLYKLCLKNILF